MGRRQLTLRKHCNPRGSPETGWPDILRVILLLLLSPPCRLPVRRGFFSPSISDLHPLKQPDLFRKKGPKQFVK